MACRRWAASAAGQPHLDTAMIALDCAVGPLDQLSRLHAVAEQLGRPATREANHLTDRARPRGSVEIEKTEDQERCVRDEVRSCFVAAAIESDTAEPNRAS